jgi:FMN phosphatase YigB (HAD superfamily)
MDIKPRKKFPMPNISRRYSTILFDWGDTVMYDEPASTVPMVEWETVRVVDGVAEVLETLHTSGRRIILATSASISDESQIHGALARGGLDRYFPCIYCFKNTQLAKGEAFYRHILSDQGISAVETLMVGDGFEKDVQIPNSLGMFAVWFNQWTEERHMGELHITVHSMQELNDFFRSLG